MYRLYFINLDDHVELMAAITVIKSYVISIAEKKEKLLRVSLGSILGITLLMVLNLCLHV